MPVRWVRVRRFRFLAWPKKWVRAGIRDSEITAASIRANEITMASIRANEVKL